MISSERHSAKRKNAKRDKDNAETLSAPRFRKQELVSFVGQSFYPWEFAATQEFEGGASSGGDVGDLAGES
jgi:hypothetical protein